MRTWLLIVLQVVLLAGVLPSSALHAQAPPSDFKFSATTGGTAPWSEMARITIDNAGQAKYVRYKTGGAPAILADSTFTISASGLQHLWNTIQDSSFFSMTPTWADTTVHGGSFARVTVTANGVTHQVSVRNIVQPQIQAILDSLNATVPANQQLQYTPPEKFDYTPKNPCSSTFGALGSIPSIDTRLRSSLDLKLRAFPGPYFPSVSRVMPDELSHPGVVVACDVSLEDAIANGWANLSSKGNFFGDDVSITINSQNHPPCNTIEITLYLEFWGPLATEDNVNQICADIAKKWDGATTSGGQKIQIGFKTRTDSGANSPPNTPGYDDIQLVGNGFRSYVTGSNFGVNNGTGSGVWEVGGPSGEYAHEAGHLMGLPDRYDDYNKQPDGSWKNANTGQSFANDDDFANYAKTKYPNADLNDIKNTLKDGDTYSIPRDGHENDLMGAADDNPLLQSDIDQITGHPGLLVIIPDGTILANRNNDAQNLIVTHGDDIFVGQNTARTLNGIYAACIDHFKSIPDSAGVFDVAPPVDQWAGIQAAAYMARLIHFVDSAQLYCDLKFATQEAIWRISDNASTLFSNSVDQLFSQIGINLGNQILDFPRLRGSGSNDAASHPFIPTELYVANIQPAFADGQVGVAASLHATVFAPLGIPRPAGITWTATGPDGAPASISGTDTTASLIPARSGVYEVALDFSLNDSVQGQKSFVSDRKGYVIVPDNYTETFEHAGLTDKYPWKSYGDVPWTITNTNPETGGYAAQPGTVAANQPSTLGIEVSLSADSVIVFSVRSFTTDFFDGVMFSIDSLWRDSFSGGFDWQVHKYKLRAGKHLLTWTYSSSSPAPGNSVWLDNIFFPGNVVVTSVGDTRADIPKTFALEQNYPNPFNPKTGIRFQVPGISDVKITVYDVLGREVAVLVNERKLPGRYEVTFDGDGLASGTYFYRMVAGDFVMTKKFLLLK